MAYSLSVDTVRTNREILEAILLVVVEKGEELHIDVAPERLTNEQYKMFQLLKSAEVFIEEFDGRFAELRGQVRVTLEKDHLLIRPKSGRVSAPRRRNEVMALADLGKYRGNMAILEFFPSAGFDLEKFKQSCLDLGWRAYVDMKEDRQADGSLRFPVDRVESGEDVMKKLGFGDFG